MWFENYPQPSPNPSSLLELYLYTGLGLVLGLELKVLIYEFVTFTISGVHQPIFRLPFHRGDVVKNVCPRPVRLHGLSF